MQLKAAAAQAGTTVQDLKAQAGAVLNTSAGAIKQCIDSALSAWNTYDLDKDGKLTITGVAWQGIHCTPCRLLEVQIVCL